MMLEAWLIAMWIFLLGMGWYPCGCAVEECSYCSVQPGNTMSVTIGSVVDQDCSDCDTFFNATHTLTKTSACQWEKTGTYCSGTTYRIVATTKSVGLPSAWGWEVDIWYESGVGGVQMYWKSAGTGSAAMRTTATFTSTRGRRASV